MMIESIFMMLLMFNAVMLVISSVLYGIGFIGFVSIVAKIKTSETRFDKWRNEQQHKVGTFT